MCNLYSVTKGQAAIIAVARVMRDTTGNLPLMFGIAALSRKEPRMHRMRGFAARLA